MDLSDFSQVFEVDDIFTFSEDITASEWRGLEEENDCPSLGPEFSFLKVRSCKFWVAYFVANTNSNQTV